MITLTRILCPVDGSDFSRRALAYATAVAEWYDASVTAVSVRPRLLPSALWSGFPGPMPVGGPAAPPVDEQGVQKFVRQAAGDSVVTVVTEGSVVEEILRVASSLPADLVVMGTHGAGGFDRLLLGSVTERVLRKAPCPVLTVPKHASDARPATPLSFQTIVCAIDFSAESLRGLEFALSLAQETDGQIVFVHALEGLDGEDVIRTAHFNVPEFKRLREHDAQARLAALVPADAREWCTPRIEVGHGKAYREVLRIADEAAADLIVLGVRGHGAVATLFGSTTQHVLRSAGCPVLTVSAAHT
ncbi:MAG: universal stress protein [Acidobacteriota bacterium]